MGRCIYLNGKFVNTREEALISAYDHGFLYGDGIFEGIRVYNGRVFKLHEHIERLYHSAISLMINIPMSMEEMEKAVVETCQRSGMDNIYVRLVVSRGPGDFGLDPRKCPKPTVVIMADEISLYPKDKYEKGLKVVTCSTRRNRPDCINSQIKSLNYLNNILAKIETVKYGADEGVMLNDAGYVCEATADNIFIIKNAKKLFTPPAYLGLLEGITRDTVMNIAKELGYEVIEMPFTVHEIYASQECFLTGSGAELIPVIEIDGRLVGDGKPGKHFKKLLDAYQKMTHSQGVPIKSATVSV
ncbi:MAG TPA: branched-chain-amino-acid transaminase [Planctomycetota bacterium]|nr:branched-chain-amino-acid transaminase [Planctomycetota bacterium]